MTEEVTIGQGLPKPEGPSKSVAAVYLLATSTIYISEADPERILDQDAREKTKKAFLKVGRPELYEKFLFVAKEAEELAHFVQHTRDQLPQAKGQPPQLAESENISQKHTGWILKNMVDNLFRK